jgi:molybdopterin converting factor small subunit
VKVELVGHLRQEAGGHIIEIELGGSTGLGDALRRLPPNLRRHILSADGSINPGILVLVNGADVRSLVDGEVFVDDDDTVTIIPSIHGGFS